MVHPGAGDTTSSAIGASWATVAATVAWVFGLGLLPLPTISSMSRLGRSAARTWTASVELSTMRVAISLGVTANPALPSSSYTTQISGDELSRTALTLVPVYEGKRSFGDAELPS